MLHRTLLLLALGLLMSGACPAPPPASTPSSPPRVVRRQAIQARRFVTPEAYRQYLLAELARGQKSGADTVRHLRLALAEDPGSPYLRLRLAELLLARGQLPEALRLTRAAQRVAPGFAESYILHGRLLAIHRPRQAVAQLEKGLRLDPGDERGYLWLARVRLRLGDPVGERAAYGRLLKAHPDHAEALFGLARAWARQGKGDRARKLLQRLLRAHPFALRPRLLLARLHLLAGQSGSAVKALLDAMEASADDPLVAQELFRLYRVRGQDQRARDLVALMGVHASARLLAFVATLYDALGQPRQALQTATRSLRQDPHHGPSLALRARLLLRSGGPRLALKSLDRIKKGKGLVAARVARAEILENEGRPRVAIRLLRQTLRVQPRSAALQETLALMYARLGRVKDALRSVVAVGRLLSRAPDDAHQRYLMALVLEEAGRFPRAARIARRLIADDPDDDQALNLLGYGLAQRGIDLPRAVQLLRRARRLDPLSPYVLDSLGWARHRQGHHAQAATLLRRACRADGRLAEPWDHLGDVLAAQGRAGAAVRAYGKALARHPAIHRRAVIAGKIARLRPSAYVSNPSRPAGGGK